jgi:hypothetical protein
MVVGLIPGWPTLVIGHLFLSYNFPWIIHLPYMSSMILHILWILNILHDMFCLKDFIHYYGCGKGWGLPSEGDVIHIRVADIKMLPVEHTNRNSPTPPPTIALHLPE